MGKNNYDPNLTNAISAALTDPKYAGKPIVIVGGKITVLKKGKTTIAPGVVVNTEKH
jgi:hypothetical protein